MSRISASRFRRALDADVLLERDDRLVGGRGADDQVGLDQGLVEPVERDARPPQRAAAASARSGSAVGDEDLPGLQGLEVLQGQVAHLAGADDEHGLVGERVEDLAGHVDGHAGDRELALVHAGPLADELADAEGVLEDRVEDRADRLLVAGGAVCLDLERVQAIAPSAGSVWGCRRLLALHA